MKWEWKRFVRIDDQVYCAGAHISLLLFRWIVESEFHVVTDFSLSVTQLVNVKRSLPENNNNNDRQIRIHLAAMASVDLAGILGNAWADTEGLVGERWGKRWTREGTSPHRKEVWDGKLNFSLEVACFGEFCKRYFLSLPSPETCWIFRPRWWLGEIWRRIVV